jgi:4-aminobutyrate aminotransferase-like enzyme
MSRFDSALQTTAGYLEKVERLEARYRGGALHVHLPPGFADPDYTLEEALGNAFRISGAVREAAAQGLFFSLPIAFDPSESAGPYLASVDRDASGEPYRFLDLGALIATQGYGENDPAVVEAILMDLPYAVSRYAHSEYQTVLSLRLKAELARIAPTGTPRYFVVNTGAEAVENAIKAVLLNRVRTGAAETEGSFLISFAGAFHGRTLGALAVTHRKKARLGFPTFDWPHVSFPFDDPRAPAETAAREERALREIWDVIVSGRMPHAQRSKDAFRRELAAVDVALADPGTDWAAFVAGARAQLSAETLRRARRAAGVLVEPIQGEGGVRQATPRFFARLRVLTRVYDVPLIFDEVQTGWGATGRLWAHEAFALPMPPDAVVWAKKAQNGVLFVSEELATFFQEERKFNTTWEGDSVGMTRLLALLARLDLEEVRRTGDLARGLLDELRAEFPDFLEHVRGAGVMLALDVARPDWRDVVRDRAFRLGLILLPAGERTLRFYPRYDMEPYAVREAVALLRQAIRDTISRPPGLAASIGPKVRVGLLDCPLACLEEIELDAAGFASLRESIMAVEIERYGALAQYPPDVLRSGRRPLLQYEAETLEATLAAPRSTGVALRDRVSGRVVAYALGGPLENHDEQGVRDDPHHGEGATFYLQATASLPSIRNVTEVEARLLELVLARVAAGGFEHISTLIEERVVAARPAFLAWATRLRAIDNYLGSGICFVYATAPVRPPAS